VCVRKTMKQCEETKEGERARKMERKREGEGERNKANIHMCE